MMNDLSQKGGPDRQYLAGRSRIAPAALAVGLSCLTMYHQVLPVFGVMLQRYFGIGLSRFGLLLSSGMVPGAVCAYFAGVLAERWGPRRVLGGCFLGSAAGMALAALGMTWSIMLVGYVLMSCFYSPVYLCLQSLLVQRFPERRRQMISLALITTSAMGALLPLWVELLKHLVRAWSMSFSRVLHVPFGVLAAALLICGWSYLRPGNGPTGRVSENRRRLSLRMPKASVLLVLILCIHGSCDVALFAWLPRILESQAYDRITFQPGTVMAAFLVAYTISRTVLMFIPGRVGRRMLVILPGILGGTIAMLGVFSRSQALTCFGLVAGALLWSLELPTALSLLAERDQAGFAKAQATFLLIGGLGGFLLTSLMGVLGDRLSAKHLWILLLLPLAGYPLFGVLSGVWLGWYGSSPNAPASSE